MFLFDAHSHLPVAPAPVPEHPRVVCGTREGDWEAILAHAGSQPGVLPMLGLHPWFVAEASPDWAARLDALLRRNRMGIGECGLDFARATAGRSLQLEVLRTQLQLAHQHRRPVALHVVKAWGPLLEVLRTEGVPQAGAMVHAFSGSVETAAVLQAMGIFLSFSAQGLAPDHTSAQAALRTVPSSLLLLETDGTADLPATVLRAAELRGVAAEDLALRTWKNGQRCFRELLP